MLEEIDMSEKDTIDKVRASARVTSESSWFVSKRLPMMSPKMSIMKTGKMFLKV